MPNALSSFLRTLFVFLLRLLIVLVVLSLGLWLVTANWGVRQVSQALANEASQTSTSYIEIRKGDQVVRMNSSRPSEIVGVGSTPAPLIVIWRPDQRKLNEWTAYFWFFGYTKQISKS